MSAKKTEILFEDLTAMADKWTSAMSGKEFSQNYMTLLLNGHGADEQHPNNVRAKGPDVHGSQMFLQMLGDIMINADDFHRAVKKVTSSPVIEDNKKAQIELIKMLKKARMIKRLVMILRRFKLMFLVTDYNIIV